MPGTPVSNEESNDYPWLASWNKVDEDAKLNILRMKIMELETNLSTASIIILCLVAIIVVVGAIMLIGPVFSLTSDQANQLIGFAKSTFKK
jgi:hypothetical protein